MSKAQNIRTNISVETVDKELTLLFSYAIRLYKAAIISGSVVSKLVQNTNKDIDLYLEHRLAIDPFHSNMSDAMSKLYSEYVDIMQSYKITRKQVKQLNIKIERAKAELLRLQQLRKVIYNAN